MASPTVSLLGIICCSTGAPGYLQLKCVNGTFVDFTILEMWSDFCSSPNRVVFSFQLHQITAIRDQLVSLVCNYPGSWLTLLVGGKVNCGRMCKLEKKLNLSYFPRLYFPVLPSPLFLLQIPHYFWCHFLLGFLTLIDISLYIRTLHSFSGSRGITHFLKDNIPLWWYQGVVWIEAPDTRRCNLCTEWRWTTQSIYWV